MASSWQQTLALLGVSTVLLLSFVVFPQAEVKSTSFTLHSAADTYVLPTLATQPFSSLDPWVNSLPLQGEDLEGEPFIVVFFNEVMPEKEAFLTAVEELSKETSVVGVYVPYFAYQTEEKHLKTIGQELPLTIPYAIDSTTQFWNAHYRPALPSWHLFNDKQERVASVTHTVAKAHAKITELTQILNSGKEIRIPVLVQNNALKTPVNPLNRLNGDCYQEFSKENTFRQCKEQNLTTPFTLKGRWKRIKDSLVAGASASLSATIKTKELSAVFSLPTQDPQKIFVTLNEKSIPQKYAASRINYDKHGRSFVQVYASKQYQILKDLPFKNHRIEFTPEKSEVAVHGLLTK